MGLVGSDGTINDDHLQHRVNVPDNKSSGLEIIGSLGRHVNFRGTTVVVLTSNLDGEGWRPFDEPHGIVGEGTNIIRGIRGKRLSTGRKLRHGKAHTVRECLTAGRMLMSVGDLLDVSSHPVRLPSRRHVLDDPSTDQLRLAGSTIKVFAESPVRVRRWPFPGLPSNLRSADPLGIGF